MIKFFVPNPNLHVWYVSKSLHFHIICLDRYEFLGPESSGKMIVVEDGFAIEAFNFKLWKHCSLISFRACNLELNMIFFFLFCVSRFLKKLSAVCRIKKNYQSPYFPITY